MRALVDELTCLIDTQSMQDMNNEEKGHHIAYLVEWVYTESKRKKKAI